MKKILLTGANGFLGQHLALHLSKCNFNIIATGRGGCRIPAGESMFAYVDTDLTNKAAVENLLSHCNPDVIIHNAALSKPDECESNPSLCLQVNVETTKHLLAAKAHFIYISTDFIFGENGPHAENAAIGPLNFYGESKLLAEQLVQSTANKYSIVRPAFIYGKTWQGMRPSFLHWVKNSLEQKKAIKVVSDQQRTPTFASDICWGIQQIVEKEATGIYNLAGKDVLSPYEMAIHIANVLQLDASLIEKVTAESFPEPVKRAKKSGLLINKATRDLHYNPVSFTEGVKLTFS